MEQPQEVQPFKVFLLRECDELCEVRGEAECVGAFKGVEVDLQLLVLGEQGHDSRRNNKT